MSAPKTRPMNGALQRIMGTFKQFENKLDKLQEDVTTHGQTLDELRNLMTNISGSTLENNVDYRSDDLKRAHKLRTEGIQYDNYVYDPPLSKSSRKNAFRKLPSKLKAKSVQLIHNDGAFIKTRILANTKNLPGKHSIKNIRQSKAESPRKATLRPQKTVAVIRNTVPK